jgi:AcrR family transcriptional regulator
MRRRPDPPGHVAKKPVIRTPAMPAQTAETERSVHSLVAGAGEAGLWEGMGVAHPVLTERTVETTPASPRQRLIEAATRLFCRYGVNSVGVDAIVEAAGTAKTTLYKVFGSKEGLVEAVLDAEGRAWRAWFLAEIDGCGGTPAERLQRIGPALRQWFSRADFYGCPFINAVGESDKADDRMRALAIAHKKVVLERLAALCAEAGLHEPLAVAHRLGLVIDGAIVAALVTRDAGVADGASRACMAVLRDAREDAEV